MNYDPQGYLHDLSTTALLGLFNDLPVGSQLRSRVASILSARQRG